MLSQVSLQQKMKHMEESSNNEHVHAVWPRVGFLLGKPRNAFSANMKWAGLHPMHLFLMFLFLEVTRKCSWHTKPNSKNYRLPDQNICAVDKCLKSSLVLPWNVPVHTLNTKTAADWSLVFHMFWTQTCVRVRGWSSWTSLQKDEKTAFLIYAWYTEWELTRSDGAALKLCFVLTLLANVCCFWKNKKQNGH